MALRDRLAASSKTNPLPAAGAVVAWAHSLVEAIRAEYAAVARALREVVVREAPLTLANDTQREICREVTGFVYVADVTNQASAVYEITGPGHSASLAFGAPAHFDDVLGTVNRINVGWNGNAYVVENKLGADCVLAASVLGGTI